MANIADLNRIKQRADDAKQATSRAEGALAQVQARLKTEFGCDSLPEAKAKLKELQAKGADALGRFDSALEAFNAEFGDLL
jgi:hypothetical protein